MLKYVVLFALLPLTVIGFCVFNQWSLIEKSYSDFKDELWFWLSLLGLVTFFLGAIFMATRGIDENQKQNPRQRREILERRDDFL